MKLLAGLPVESRRVRLPWEAVVMVKPNPPVDSPGVGQLDCSEVEVEVAVAVEDEVNMTRLPGRRARERTAVTLVTHRKHAMQAR